MRTGHRTSHISNRAWEIQELQNEGCEPNQSTDIPPSSISTIPFLRTRGCVVLLLGFQEFASNRAYITRFRVAPYPPSAPPPERSLQPTQQPSPSPTLFRAEAGYMVHTSWRVSQPIERISSPCARVEPTVAGRVKTACREIVIALREPLDIHEQNENERRE